MACEIKYLARDQGLPRALATGFDMESLHRESTEKVMALQRRLLAQGDDTVPIPATKRRKWLEENVAAASIRLAPEVVAALAAAWAPGKVRGPRYAPERMAVVDR